jgi:CheY-like chemotaxis protein
MLKGLHNPKNGAIRPHYGSQWIYLPGQSPWRNPFENVILSSKLFRLNMAFDNLLFIDDDNDDLHLFAEAIGNISVTANADIIDDPTVALEKLDTGEMQPDLIILDLHMPIMTGIDFLRAIKAKPDLKDIPVIVMSTATDNKTIREAELLGAKEYIIKPNSFPEIEAIFKRLLGL